MGGKSFNFSINQDSYCDFCCQRLFKYYDLLYHVLTECTRFSNIRCSIMGKNEQREIRDD